MIMIILQARYNSSRLPGKVLLPVLNQPMLARQIERIQRAKQCTQLVVATSSNDSDNAIEKLCQQIRIPCFRGSLDDVLDRVYQAAQSWRPTHVVRLTGDCPLIDPEVIDQVVTYHLQGEFDYTSNALQPTYPDGLDVEVMRFAALEKAWKEAKLPSEREHVTPFLYNNSTRFKVGYFKNNVDLSGLRWTVDRQKDFELITQIYAALYPTHPEFTTADILQLLEQRPELKTLNLHYLRNEGMQKSLQADAEFLRTHNHVDSI